MPRGGHNKKSIEQHKSDGTYRADRHGKYGPPRRPGPAPGGWGGKNVHDMPGVDQLAERLGKTRATIFNWLRLGKIPPPRGQVGNRKIWDPKEIEAWIAAGCPTVEEFERLLEDDE